MSDASVVRLRRDLHAHPELAFAEHRTAAVIAERLTAAGLEVRTGIAGTGVVAILRGSLPGRTIAWRADMDALPIEERVTHDFASRNPGVMHACGHDGHVAIAVTVAEHLASRRASLSGTSVFVFQPAEEVFQGARAMIAAGVLSDPRIEELYGLHLTTAMPCGQVGVRTGAMWASADAFEIVVDGKGGHGAFPHQAVDPLLVAAHLLISFSGLVEREISAQRSAVLSVGELHAGSAYNVIADHAVLRGSLRALDDDTRAHLLERLPLMASAIASAHRATARVSWSESACPCLVNHQGPAAHVRACAEAAVDVLPSLASDDMSLFLRERPGCYFKLGCALPGVDRPHHSPLFDLDERALTIGVQLAIAILEGRSKPG